MLRVTVELVPQGNESTKRVIGVMQIGLLHVGGHNNDLGDYQIQEMTPIEAECLTYTLEKVPRGATMPIFDFLSHIFTRQMEEMEKELHP